MNRDIVRGVDRDGRRDGRSGGEKGRMEVVMKK
jgi:hypothetical protein